MTILIVALLAVCLTIQSPAASQEVASAPFSHADFDRVLARFVDDRGRVDYTGLATDPSDLDRYVAQLAAVSPDSHPDRFPTPQARLAYWINAYNASVMQLVLHHYPIASVRDVRPPAVLFFLPRSSGFFYFERVTLGAERMNLYDLENSVIRRRFPEPRVHFALNCASRGCPQLPRQAFTAEHLDDELDRETRRFLAEPRNLTVDPSTRTIFLSSIFDWYEDDFLASERRAGSIEPTLLGYVGRNSSAEQAAQIAGCEGCRVSFVPYDWRLNDQRQTEPETTDEHR